MLLALCSWRSRRKGSVGQAGFSLGGRDDLLLFLLILSACLTLVKHPLAKAGPPGAGHPPRVVTRHKNRPFVIRQQNVLAACCVLQQPWLSAGGLWPDSTREPGSWLQAPRGLVPGRGLMTSRCLRGICGAGGPMAGGGSCKERGWGCQTWRAVCWLLAGSGAEGSPVAWSVQAASGSYQASGQHASLTSPGFPAGCWLSGIHTRMLLECCRIPASNVLCVLMDEININLRSFFLFPFYLIFSSPEDFTLLLPPLAGIKITPYQGLGCGRQARAPLQPSASLRLSCRHVLGLFACSPRVLVLSDQPVPRR